MSDDGSGVYTKLAGSVAVTSTTIASYPYNLQNDDFSTAINARLNINGTKALTGNLQMGTNKVTGVGTGTAGTDAANVGQVQNRIVGHSTAVGGTVDAITVTHAPVMTTWAAMTGWRGTFTATGANTSATPTFNPDGIGAKTLVKLNNLALVAGDIIGAGHEVEWEYNGTNVVILNPARIGNTTVSMVSKAINEAKGAAVASAGTTDIWTPADGNYVHITGTTTITSLGTAPQAGAERTVIFDGILTLTHNATSLILPGAVSITTATNDRMIVRADTTANMIVISYIRASGLPVVGTGSGLYQASTSGTSVLFSGANAPPSGTQKITVSFVSVSTTGTSPVIIQLGQGGATTTSGYAGASSAAASIVASNALSTGFMLYFQSADTAAALRQGSITITIVAGTIWAASGVTALSNSVATSTTSGAVQLAGAIDRVNITTVGGTDTFSSGFIGVLYG